MINLHKYVKEKYGLEALHHLQLWGKGVVKDSDYRNHRIFTLRCISHNLGPVSIKLKPSDSKLSIGTRKIIQRAERQLLQDRVKCINRRIEESGKNININKTKLASLVTSAEDLDKCIKFIKEVREGRYGKVKDRQVRKFQNLISKNDSNNNNRAGRDSRANNNGFEQAVNANNLDRSNNNSNNNNPMCHHN